MVGWRVEVKELVEDAGGAAPACSRADGQGGEGGKEREGVAKRRSGEGGRANVAAGERGALRTCSRGAHSFAESTKHSQMNVTPSVQPVAATVAYDVPASVSLWGAAGLVAVVLGVVGVRLV